MQYQDFLEELHTVLGVCANRKKNNDETTKKETVTRSHLLTSRTKNEATCRVTTNGILANHFTLKNEEITKLSCNTFVDLRITYTPSRSLA